MRRIRSRALLATTLAKKSAVTLRTIKTQAWLLVRRWRWRWRASPNLEGSRSCASHFTGEWSEPALCGPEGLPEISRG